MGKLLVKGCSYNTICHIIILLKSVCRYSQSIQAAVLARSSREMSQTVRIDCRSLLSAVRPSKLFVCKKTKHKRPQKPSVQFIARLLLNPFAFTNCVCIGLAVFAFKALEIPCLFAFSGGKTQKCKNTFWEKTQKEFMWATPPLILRLYGRPTYTRDFGFFSFGHRYLFYPLVYFIPKFVPTLRPHLHHY